MICLSLAHHRTLSFWSAEVSAVPLEVDHLATSHLNGFDTGARPGPVCASSTASVASVTSHSERPQLRASSGHAGAPRTWTSTAARHPPRGPGSRGLAPAAAPACARAVHRTPWRAPAVAGSRRDEMAPVFAQTAAPCLSKWPSRSSSTPAKAEAGVISSLSACEPVMPAPTGHTVSARRVKRRRLRVSLGAGPSASRTRNQAV
jgi:hypothetical protein